MPPSNVQPLDMGPPECHLLACNPLICPPPACHLRSSVSMPEPLHSRGASEDVTEEQTVHASRRSYANGPRGCTRRRRGEHLHAGDAPEGSLLLCGDAGAPYGALRRVRAVVVHSRASVLLWSGLYRDWRCGEHSHSRTSHCVVWPLETVSDCVPCVEAGAPRQHRPNESNARQSLGEVLRFHRRAASRRGRPLARDGLA
jgi:hypothetical protein